MALNEALNENLAAGCRILHEFWGDEYLTAEHSESWSCDHDDATFGRIDRRVGPVCGAPQCAADADPDWHDSGREEGVSGRTGGTACDPARGASDRDADRS